MKKNFFKKLSFVLALAMIVTVLAPAAGVFAKAAPKLNAKTKYLHLDVADKNEFDFNIANKQKGWKYLWTSSNEDVAEVNAKNGLVTATGAGKAKISVVITDKDGEEVDELAATVKVRDNIKDLTITNKPEGDKLAVGVENNFNRDYVTVSGSTTKIYGAVTRWEVTDKDGKETTGATINAKNGVFVANEAGTYTITARAFQTSSKYTSWLADATKYADYVTATATYTVTVAPSMAKVEQADLDTFKVTFDSPVTDVAKKLSVNYIVSSTKVNEVIKSITMDTDNKVATVDLYGDIKSETTYVVSYPDMDDVQFVGATHKVEDVVKIEILTSSVQVGKNTKLDVALYNKDGVNIANADLLNHVTLDIPDDTNAYKTGGLSVMMYTVGTTSNIVAKFKTWNYEKNGDEIGTLTTAKVISCVNQSVNNVGAVNAYTIGNAADTNPDYINNLVHKIAVGDPSKKLFVQLKGKDTDGNELLTSSYDNGDNSYFTFKSSDEKILVIDPNTGTLYGIKTGSVSVIIYYDGKSVGSVAVTINPKRELSIVTLSATHLTLSNATAFHDTADVTVSTAKDQLGDDYTSYSLTTKFNGSTDNNLLSNVSGTTMTFDASSVKEGTYSYTVTLTDNSNASRQVVRTVSVTVQKPSGATSYYRLETDKTSYDMKVTSTTNVAADKVVNAYIYGYAANNVKTEKLTLAASGYSLVVSSPNTVEPNMTTGSFNLLSSAPSAAVSGAALVSKLATGNYNLTATKTGSNTLNAGFVVNDTQAKTSLNRIKEISKKTTIASAFKDMFTVTLNGHNITSKLSDDSSADFYKTSYTDTAQKYAALTEVYYYEQIGSVYIKHTIAVGQSIVYNQN